MKTVDVIVLGVGGMGSAACLHLARRGVRVLGIEQFTVGHTQGSSHGESRMIRQAYFEHPDYVPLLRRAYTLWDELSEATGQNLFHRTGVLYAGPKGSSILEGVKKSARLHALKVEESPGLPGIRLPTAMQYLLEPDAGFLEVENCVRAHAAQARLAGAEIFENERVKHWTVTSGILRLTTDKGEYEARRLVIAGGAWRNEALGERLPVRVHRNIVGWYFGDGYEEKTGMPCFGFDLPEGFLYGFPQFSSRGLKAAIHRPGEPVADPAKVNRRIEPRDTEELDVCMKKVFPGIKGKAQEAAVCLYCMSPDENFVIDTHPEHPEVIYAAGFSGHGFKFASVVGEVLAELALDGRSKHPIAFLRRRPW